jgi:ABC-2 type transport system permease protein
MSRLLKIAVREYLAYVKTIGFWLSMGMMPVMIGMMAVGPQLLFRSAPPPIVTLVQADAETGQLCAGPQCAAPSPAAQAVLQRMRRDGFVIVSPPAGVPGASVAEQRRVLQPYLAGERLGLQPMPGYPARLMPRDFATRPLDYVVVLRAPFAGPYSVGQLQSVQVRIWARNVGYNAARAPVEDAIAEWTRSEALRTLGVHDDAARQLIAAEPRVETFSPRAATGRVEQRDRTPLIAGLIMGVALWSAAMTGAGILLNSVIEEKSSRILEVLLSSASVFQIMGGKILGVAMVTATVLGVWSTLGGGGFLLSQRGGEAADILALLFSRGLVFYFIFYFIAGYLMYATLFITVGAFCETSREAQTLLGPMMLILVVPLVFMFLTAVQPDSPLLHTLSWIPLFTPFLMVARAASGPPWWEVAGTAFLMMVTIAGELWLAGRAFRAGALSNAKFDPRYFFASLMGRGDA